MMIPQSQKTVLIWQYGKLRRNDSSLRGSRLEMAGSCGLLRIER